MSNELDLPVVGNCVLAKAEQDPSLKQDYSTAFELDYNKLRSRLATHYHLYRQPHSVQPNNGQSGTGGH